MSTAQYPLAASGGALRFPMSQCSACSGAVLATIVTALAAPGLTARVIVLTILGIVGAHFLPMAPAFGPPMILLGLLCAANVLLAARMTGYSLRSVWAVDGVLKAAIGALLVWLAVDGLYSAW